MVQVTNKPFLKQIFAGIFDTDMLTYPEVETNQELENLEAFVKPYEELFTSAQTLDFASKDEVRVISNKFNVGCRFSSFRWPI